MLVGGCAVAAYCTTPATRALVQVLANPAVCMQRAESLAQLLLRIESFPHVLRRSS